MKVSKFDNLIDIDMVVSKLRSAGKFYRTSRGRTGVYEFLEAAYAAYWKIKRKGMLGRRKLLLRQAAELPANPSRLLSDLVLVIASKDRDRRDRHRWKRLIEAAYRRKIDPRDFKRQLHDLHGVNNALAHWTVMPPPGTPPIQDISPGLEFTRLPTLEIPLAVDGEC